MNAFNERREMRGQGGFTLIELLVVIAILGILAGVVVFAVGGVTGTAKNKACATEARTIQTAIEAYKADNGGTFPANLAALASGTTAYLKTSPANNFTYTAATGVISAPTGNYSGVSASQCGL